MRRAGGTFANRFASDGVVHLKAGSSRETFLHEFSHADMFFHGGRQSGIFLNEIATDLRAGTMRYYSTRYLLMKAMPKDLFLLYSLNSTSLNVFSGNVSEGIVHTRLYNITQSAFQSGNTQYLENFLFAVSFATYLNKDIYK